MAKFVERDQSQLHLLSADMRDWVPDDDLSHLVVEAVNRMPMSTIAVNERGTGPVPPGDDAGAAGLLPVFDRSQIGWYVLQRVFTLGWTNERFGNNESIGSKH